MYFADPSSCICPTKHKGFALAWGLYEERKWRFVGLASTDVWISGNCLTVWDLSLTLCIAIRNLHSFYWLLQKDNVANQREHLILLLANVQMRQFPNSDQQAKVTFFFNYHFSLFFLCYYTLTQTHTYIDSSFSFIIVCSCIFPFFLFSWMIVYWLKWWRDYSRITRSGANIWVEKVVSGEACAL